MSHHVRLPLQEMPPVITESVKTALAAHGYLICDHRGQPLRNGELEAALNELGRNASQALVVLDVTPCRESSESLPCGCAGGAHPNSRNMLAGAAERDGRVCSLGWRVR